MAKDKDPFKDAARLLMYVTGLIIALFAGMALVLAVVLGRGFQLDGNSSGIKLDFVAAPTQPSRS